MDPTRDATDRLGELLDKQDIHEVLSRYCRGLDRGDAEMVAATFHPDAVHNHSGSVEPAAELVEGLRKPARKVLRSVSHMISNVLVDLQGDTALSECYFLACHRIDFDGADWTWIVGGRYLDRLERRAGGWRISERTAVYDWARTDRVGSAPADLAVAHSTDNGVWGRGDREDFSHLFAPGLNARTPAANAESTP